MLLTKVSKSNLEYIQIKKSNVHLPYLSDTSSLEFLAADSGNELKTLEGGSDCPGKHPSQGVLLTSFLLKTSVSVLDCECLA